MPADEGYKEHVMELLAPLGDVNARAMFGGYGIFHEGTMFALISGTTSTLYFKVNDSNLADFEDAGCEQFGKMPYYEVPADVLESEVEFHEWAQTAIAVGHATATKKKGQGRRSAK